MQRHASPHDCVEKDRDIDRPVPGFILDSSLAMQTLKAKALAAAKSLMVSPKGQRTE
jgi:hypothetical protein